MEQQLVVSCAGRPLERGMLYDCRNEAPIPGVTLWDHKVLDRFSDTRKRESSEYDITADDSMQNKAHAMNIEASVKVSLLGGLLKVEGAAKYLENHKSSTHQARVVLKYSCKTFFEQLTMEQLGMNNIKYPDAFDKNMATHVITAIEYGADAFFVFDRQMNNNENCRVVEGKLKASLQKIPFISLNGEAQAHISEDEHSLVNSFKCTFFGDVMLPTNPTTFDEALAAYKQLPALIRQATGKDGSQIYGVPKKAYLYPLSKLDNRAAKLVQAISDNAVADTQSILEHVQHLLARTNDLDNSDVCHKFSGIKQQIFKFKSLLYQFRSYFQCNLCELLPQIRGGGLEEVALLNKLKLVKNSVFDPYKLEKWLDTRAKEFSCLKSYLKSLQAYPFAFLPGELETFTQDSNLKYVLAISLGSITNSENPYLDSMEEFLKGDHTVAEDSWEELEESWVNDDNISTNLQTQIRLFCDFASVNKDKSDLKSIVVPTGGKKNKADTPGGIFLYTQGRRQQFQPPCAPSQPRMVSIAENEITLTWSAPILGPKSIRSYIVSNKVAGSLDNKWSEIDSENTETIYTVRQLSPDVVYVFQVAALTDVGRSQQSEISAEIKTKPPPPLAILVKDNCTRIIEGNPSWYQLPMNPQVIDKSLLLQTVEIGEKWPTSKGEKTVLIIGETGSGKSTLINGMINYLFGVEWEDDFRLQLVPKESEKSQSHSQTTYVTKYVLHWHPNSRVPYTLVLIDSPGFGDTRGIQQDAFLTKQIKTFFDKVVDHLDMVAFVIKASQTRLTVPQKFVFDSILALFGKDIAENVYLLLTFADGKTPPVLTNTDDHKIPYKAYFKFNNSVFVGQTETKRAEQSNSGSKSNLKLDHMFWDLAYTAYKEFFGNLIHVKAKSLTLTREVLEERDHLEKMVETLNCRVNDGVNHLITMRQELQFILEFEAAKTANQNYSRVINKPKTRKVNFSDGHYVTNCLICSFTCHNPCQIAKDEEKNGCAAIDQSTGDCMVCRNRCHWSKHYNRSYIYEDYIDRETITIADMKTKYLQANSDLSTKNDLLMGISQEYDNVQRDVLSAVEKIRRCLARLSEIAMRPNPLSAVEYIDLLIKATITEKKDGWEYRLEQLKNARDRAAKLKEMGSGNYNPFKELETQIQAKAQTNSSWIEKVKNLFQYKG